MLVRELRTLKLQRRTPTVRWSRRAIALDSLVSIVRTSNARHSKSKLAFLPWSIDFGADDFLDSARRAKAKQAEAKAIGKSARGLGRHGA